MTADPTTDLPMATLTRGFKVLCANVALNCLTNVIARPMALGESRGTIRVPVLDPEATNNVGGLALGGHEQGEPVTIAALDDLGDLTRLDLLKADVEGRELAVLTGARRQITTHWPMLYVEADREHKVPALVGWLAEMGYRLWVHRPPLYNPSNRRGQAENAFQGEGGVPIVSVNLLGIHVTKDVPSWLAETEHLQELGGK